MNNHFFFSSESTPELSPESESDPEVEMTEEEEERLVIYKHTHTHYLSLFCSLSLIDQ